MDENKNQILYDEPAFYAVKIAFSKPGKIILNILLQAK
jgi:hypothetical protein